MIMDCQVCEENQAIGEFTVELAVSIDPQGKPYMDTLQLTVCAHCAALWPDNSIVRVRPLKEQK